jgi:hypothetical protein
MAELPGDFGDRLVAREEVDPMRMEQLREQIAAVLEVRLSRPMRVASVAGGALFAAIAVAVALLARRHWDELPPVVYVIAIVGPIGLLLMGAIMIGVGRRGVFDRRYHGRQFLSVALLICLASGTAFLHAGWASGDSQLVFGATAMLMLGGAGFALHLLEQYHLATQRKLLELELRMAELAEQLNRPRPNEP